MRLSTVFISYAFVLAIALPIKSESMLMARFAPDFLSEDMKSERGPMTMGPSCRDCAGVASKNSYNSPSRHSRSLYAHELTRRRSDNDREGANAQPLNTIIRHEWQAHDNHLEEEQRDRQLENDRNRQRQNRQGRQGRQVAPAQPPIAHRP